MSRPRFLVDHDFNEHIIRGARRLQQAVEFLHVRDVALADAADTDVLEYAAAEGWIVLSHDVNTMTAAASTRLATGRPMRGLFLVHQRSPIASIIEELLLIWSASEAEEWAGQIRFLPL